MTPLKENVPLIMMVAQKPFTPYAGGRFCKLAPVIWADGEEALPADFPNDGEVWWMLTTQTENLAQPGRLVMGPISEAHRFHEDDPKMSRYEVNKNLVGLLGIEYGMHVILLSDNAVQDVQELVSNKISLDLEQPTPVVMVQWCSQTYGPLKASPEVAVGAGAPKRYSFSPLDETVYYVDNTTFNDVTSGYHLRKTYEFSKTDQPRSETDQTGYVRHDLILRQGYERFMASSPKRLILVPIDRTLERFATQLLPLGKRRLLNELLSELEVTGGDIPEKEILAEAINRKKRLIAKSESLDKVAKAMLETGLLGEDRIKEVEEDYGKKYVQRHSAELQAKVEKSVESTRAELPRLNAELSELRKKHSEEEAKHRLRIKEEETKSKDNMKREKEAFERERQSGLSELDRQKKMLKENLEKVTTELRVAGDEVVNRYLTIAPLLERTPFASEQQHPDRPPTVVDGKVEHESAEFKIPTFATNLMTRSENTLSEQEFFDRFVNVVNESGFAYRDLDLQRFHLSVKSGDLTVLGGPSGTGKSSLPRLYGRALLGDSADDWRRDCLMVNVNPSWMDTRDLLGHLNTLDGRFYPAESQLFQYLVYAQEEHKARQADTGLYLVCLDEMNLSQVEHYFSDFMMVIERSGSDRSISCFSPEVAASNSPFMSWARVELSPALRVVGTVNFDETTRLLSDRFLDRVNLIQIATAPLRAAEVALATARGRIVTLADVEAWRTDETVLPSELASLLDRMRPLLTQVGQPISPRVYGGICRFVASSKSIMEPERAFDVQVAQRIIPRIRGLVTKRQLDALDDLMRVMTETDVCSFDESGPMLEEISHLSSMRPFGLEE